MTEAFTTKDHDAAAEHGWRLVPIWDTRGYSSWAVVSIVEASTPSQTQSSVLAQAKRGIKVARKALALIAQEEIAGRVKTNPRRKK